MARTAKEGILTPQLEFIRLFVRNLAEMTALKTKDTMKPLLYLIPPALVSIPRYLKQRVENNSIFPIIALLFIGNMAKIAK